MKKVFLRIGRGLVILLCLAVLIWILSTGKTLILTAVVGNQFKVENIADFDYLHAFSNNPKHRVLSYWGNTATVYYYSYSGGEKVKLVKHNGEWVYQESTAAWSRSGSAEDYLIWPYFKNYGI